MEQKKEHQPLARVPQYDVLLRMLNDEFELQQCHTKLYQAGVQIEALSNLGSLDHILDLIGFPQDEYVLTDGRTFTRDKYYDAFNEIKSKERLPTFLAILCLDFLNYKNLTMRTQHTYFKLLDKETNEHSGQARLDHDGNDDLKRQTDALSDWFIVEEISEERYNELSELMNKLDSSDIKS